MKNHHNHQRGAHVLAGVVLGFLAGAAAMYAYTRTPAPIIGAGSTPIVIPTASAATQSAPLMKRVPESPAPVAIDETKAEKPASPTSVKVRAPKPVVSTVININTASQAELELLPEVGPSLAKAILAYREAHGPFTKIEELDRVKGIGPKVLAKISPMVTVSSELP